MRLSLRKILPTLLAAFAVLGGSTLVLADITPANIPARAIPPEYQNVGVDEHGNLKLPMDLTFLNERAEVVKLGDLFKSGKPVIMQLGYYGCPKLCDVISRSFIESSRQISLNLASDYQFVFVSINPSESPDLANAKRQSYVQFYDRSGCEGGFHCLVGSDINIHLLATALGYRYHPAGTDGVFAHPAVLFVLTPDGRISRYLYGVSVPPETLRLSLVEASEGKIGTSFDKLALFICCYDVDTGKYAMTAIGVMRLSACATMMTLGGGILWLFWHGRRSRFPRIVDSSGAKLVNGMK